MVFSCDNTTESVCYNLQRVLWSTGGLRSTLVGSGDQHGDVIRVTDCVVFTLLTVQCVSSFSSSQVLRQQLGPLKSAEDKGFLDFRALHSLISTLKALTTTRALITLWSDKYDLVFLCGGDVMHTCTIQC